MEAGLDNKTKKTMMVLSVFNIVLTLIELPFVLILFLGPHSDFSLPHSLSELVGYAIWIAVLLTLLSPAILTGWYYTFISGNRKSHFFLATAIGFNIVLYSLFILGCVTVLILR